MSSEALPGNLANATLRLSMNGEKSPKLRKAEAEARLKLAAAIILMDAKQDVIGQHSLYEQHAVNEALRNYGNALASLVRNEEKPQ